MWITPHVISCLFHWRPLIKGLVNFPSYLEVPDLKSWTGNGLSRLVVYSVRPDKLRDSNSSYSRRASFHILSSSSYYLTLFSLSYWWLRQGSGSSMYMWDPPASCKSGSHCSHLCDRRSIPADDRLDRRSIATCGSPDVAIPRYFLHEASGRRNGSIV